MARTIRFTKMHGAGNDYIYVNTDLFPIENPSQLAELWSQQHKGIGSDGLVLIAKSVRDDADYAMRIFNADGSEAMMCGNASRCIAKYLYEKGLCRQKTIRLETLSGIKILQLHIDENDIVQRVTVDMLQPQLVVPEQFNEALGRRIEIDGTTFEGTFVSMGNPHYVVFVDDVSSLDIAYFGSKLERNSAFPQRCNIEFAQLLDSETIRMRVWERGSGITMACGTGSCATAVASALTNRTGRRCKIVMDGGELEIEWNALDNHVYMTGAATLVFEGEILVND